MAGQIGAMEVLRGYRVSSMVEKQFEEQFKNIQELLNCAESKRILYEVRDEDILMFIGNTKSGKSTLVNYCIGNELRAVKKKTVPFTMRIEKINDEEMGPTIGMESVSETTLPTVWTATKSGIKEKLVDAPGFEDNRGETQDIANAFYIKEIIRNAKSVKFVLITDIRDITGDNISSFTNFMDKIDKIFPDTSVLHGSIRIVFSKGDGKFSSSDICDLLKETILNQSRMVVSARSLIQYIAYNKECIEFFNVPALEGSINNACVGLAVTDIANTITGIPNRELVNVHPGVSERSKIFLLLSHSQFCNIVEYLRVLEKVKDGFARKSDAIHEIKKVEEVCEMDETLLEMEKMVNQLVPKTETVLCLKLVLSKIFDLGNICGVEDQIQCNNMNVKLQFVEFLDETLGLNNSNIYFEKLDETIKIIQNEISRARLLASMKLNKLNAKQMALEMKELKEKHEAEMRKSAERIEKLEEENRKKTQKQIESSSSCQIL